MEVEFPTNQISQFNDAMLQIQRLNNIWTECKILRERGMLILCKWKLDSAEIELWRDAERLDSDKRKKKKDEKDIPEQDKLTSKINAINSEIIKAQIRKSHSKLYLKLLEKEKLLRKVQDLAGKGAKMKSADDDGM